MGCGPSLPMGFDAALKRYSPRLRIRWDIERDVWVVEEKGRTDGQWYYVMFWADRGPGGALVFRRLPETPEPILERLAQIDVAKMDRAPKHAAKAWLARMEGQRKEYIAKEKAAQSDARKQRMHEGFAYHMRGRRGVGLDQSMVPKP